MSVEHDRLMDEVERFDRTHADRIDLEAVRDRARAAGFVLEHGIWFWRGHHRKAPQDAIVYVAIRGWWVASCRWSWVRSEIEALTAALDYRDHVVLA